MNFGRYLELHAIQKPNLVAVAVNPPLTKVTFRTPPLAVEYSLRFNNEWEHVRLSYFFGSSASLLHSNSQEFTIHQVSKITDLLDYESIEVRALASMHIAVFRSRTLITEQCSQKQVRISEDSGMELEINSTS